MAKNKNEKISTALLNEKTAKTNAGNGKKTTQTRVKPAFAAIAPIIDVTNNDFFEMASGEFMEIVQIETKDTYSLNMNDLKNDIFNHQDFYISTAESIKIVPLNMNMQLDTQKRFIVKKLNYCKHPVQRELLQARLDEFEKIEKFRTNREFFMFVYHKDELKLKQLLNQIQQILLRSTPIKYLTLEKKMSVLFQLANPLTKPILE